MQKGERSHSKNMFKSHLSFLNLEISSPMLVLEIKWRIEISHLQQQGSDKKRKGKIEQKMTGGFWRISRFTLRSKIFQKSYFPYYCTHLDVNLKPLISHGFVAEQENNTIWGLLTSLSLINWPKMLKPKLIVVSAL